MSLPTSIVHLVGGLNLDFLSSRAQVPGVLYYPSILTACAPQVPLGGWAQDKRLCEAGQYLQLTMLNDVEGELSQVPFLFLASYNLPFPALHDMFSSQFVSSEKTGFSLVIDWKKHPLGTNTPSSA